MASKQSEQERQESTAQSQQGHQSEWQEWKRPSWVQSAVRNLKKSAMQKIQVAMQPQWQFLVFGVLQLLSWKYPSVDEFMKTVAAPSGAFQSVLYKVLTVQACQLLWTGCQCLNSIRDEVGKTAITSQVVATRANINEWRQCLKFGSQWHNTSLQGAYMLWQSSSLTAPACPANQWMKVESGQPMMPSDAQLARKDITTVKLAQIAVEARLTEYHELAVHHKAGVQQLDQHKLQLIQKVDEWYWQFVTQHQEFVNKTQEEQERELERMNRELDQVDERFYSKQYTVPVLELKKAR